jgi:trk system potassium uptake protein TrkA
MTLNVIKKGQIAIVEFDIPAEGCKSCDKKIKDLGLPYGCVLATILRGDEVIIPRGDISLQPGDAIIAVTQLDKEAGLKSILMGE